MNPLTTAGLICAFTLSSLVVCQGNRPRLVAYGCEGAKAPLYAEEEDHFPLCQQIERNL